MTRVAAGCAAPASRSALLAAPFASPRLTGLAQIRGFRGATDHEDDLSSRLQSDLEYINGWTILRDVRILLATAMVLLHDRAF